MTRWLEKNSRSRRLLIAVGLYLIVVAINFAVTPKQRILTHTAFNHFALLAEAWLDGRLDLDGPPPPYAQNNDFAHYGERWFVAFPPFPALLLLPVVAFADESTDVRDGQFFIWLSGIGPAVLFLALETLRRAARSTRTERTNAILALLFAFGTVYFFVAVQGTVWFAAHTVGVGLAALYLLFALNARHPWLAGAMIGFAFLTRPPLIFAVPLFAYEALRRASEPLDSDAKGSIWRELVARVRHVKVKRLVYLYAAFSIPILACIAFSYWHNAARFGDPFDVGYEHLTVAWQARMKKWGLFHYHYLARNLGISLTSLPWYTPDGKTPFQVNAHGLALWFTTPLYLWLIWPKTVRGLEVFLYLTAAAVAVPSLLYQNSGWIQFGYRFSNDYAVFLFALLATTNVRMGKLFGVCAVWSVAVNAFGAWTFDRGGFRGYYHEDRSQKIIYQPD